MDPTFLIPIAASGLIGFLFAFLGAEFAFRREERRYWRRERLEAIMAFFDTVVGMNKVMAEVDDPPTDEQRRMLSETFPEHYHGTEDALTKLMFLASREVWTKAGLYATSAYQRWVQLNPPTDAEMAQYEASLSKKEAVAGVQSLHDAAYHAFVDAARKELGNKGGGLDPKSISSVLDDALRRAGEDAK